MVSGRRVVMPRGVKGFVLAIALLATSISFGASMVHSTVTKASGRTQFTMHVTRANLGVAHSTVDLSKAPKLSAESAQPVHEIHTKVSMPAGVSSKTSSAQADVPTAVTEAKLPESVRSNFVGGNGIPLLVKGAAGLHVTTTISGGDPPNPAIAVGGAGAAVNQYVVEGVNTSIAIYHTDLTLAEGPISTDSVFASVKIGGDFFRDPQITYDADRVHWVIAYMELTPSNQVQSGIGHGYLDIAISAGANAIYPNGIPATYNVYRFDMGLNNNTEWCDSPTLGMEYWNLYVSCMTYNMNGNVIGNRLFMFNKTDMINGVAAGSVHTSYIADIPSPRTCGANCTVPAFYDAPAIENGVPNAEYVVAIDTFMPGTAYNATVVAITNPNGLFNGTTIGVSGVVADLAAGYATPVAAEQPGTTALVPVDVGIKQFMYKGGNLWFSFTTGIDWQGDTATRTAAYWTEIEPFLSTKAAHDPQQITGWENRQQGYFGYVGYYVYMPSIQPDDEGDAALVYNTSNSTHYASILYTGRKGDDALNTMGQTSQSSGVIIGTNPNGSHRWGAYSTCALNVQPTTRGYAYCVGEYGGPDANATVQSGWDTYMYVLRMN